MMGVTFCSANEWPWTPNLFWMNGLLLPDGYDSRHNCHRFSFSIPFVFEMQGCFRDAQTPVYQLFQNPVDGPYFFREFLTFKPGHTDKKFFELPNQCANLEPGPCCDNSENKIMQKTKGAMLTPGKFATIIKSGWKDEK